MCAGDDRDCPEFELHRQTLLDDLDAERRRFLKSAFRASGGAAVLAASGVSLVSPAAAQTVAPRQGKPSHHYVPATAETVHWGYFSKLLKPVVEIDSGDYVTIETLTHHANDDAERMVKGDPGAESVYFWSKDKKGVDRRGAGPIDGKLLGRGSGEGFGVHICTGPVYLRNAEPGDVIELRIMDVKPRPSANPAHAGKSFGSNAAAWWGFHYKELMTEPKPREVITIYEIDATGQRNWAQAVYNFQWTPQTDPFGVVHKTIDYPGVPVDHTTIKENHGILKNVRIPVRPHFGVIGLAPKEADVVDSKPPGYFGGNIDNWRIGKGATMYYPVSVPGALLSAGDPHASQGDSEMCGTAIECSLTGTFQVILHKKETLAGTSLESLNYPLLETQDEWLLHGFSYANYLQELVLLTEVSRPRIASTMEDRISSYIGPLQTVLVVDDDEVQRNLVRELLVPLGFEVMTASNGWECLALAEQRRPGLILLDIAMPEMDGWEVPGIYGNRHAKGPPYWCCRQTSSTPVGWTGRSGCTTTT